MTDGAAPSVGLRGSLTVESLLGLYTGMLRVRVFEERTADLLEASQINTPCHLYIGQEAVAVGACATLRTDDYIFGNHRSHGHYLAKGGDMKAMMSEMFGRKTGCSRGRGGSMHLIAPEVGMLGAAPIVSGTIPLAVGAALATKLQGLDRVAVAFFGDGAVEEGTTHESMNLAAHRRLPVVFVCENNFYASHLSLMERRTLDNIFQAGGAHGMHGERVDGNDVLAVRQATAVAVQRARAGEGPTLLECRTFRWRGHVGPSWDMDVGVKRRDELAEWLSRDPITQLGDQLLSLDVPSTQLEQIAKDLRDEVGLAIEYALASPFPEEDELLEHVYYDGAEMKRR